MILNLIFAAGVALQPGAVLSVGTGTWSGIEMPDQWGNPWVEVSAYDKKRAVIKVYDCGGVAENVGEVPLSSLGSGDNFRGFRPYQNASLWQLEAVYLQHQFERECLASGNAGHACGLNPQRSDCRVMEVPNGGGKMFHKEAADWFNAVHPEKGK